MNGLIFKAVLVGLITVLVGGVAYAYSKSQPEKYLASSQLEFGRLLAPDLQVLGSNAPGDPQIDEEVRINTELATVNSFDVAEETARRAPQLGLTAPQIAGGVTAQAIRGTLVVRVTASSTTPQRANRLANFYTDSYVALRRDREEARARTSVRALNARLDSLPASDSRGPVGASLRNQISTLRVLQRVGSGSPEVIERARTSSVASEPQTRRNVLFGLLFGLAAGLGLVALRTSTGGSGGPGGVAVPGQRETPSPSEPPVFR